MVNVGGERQYKFRGGPEGAELADSRHPLEETVSLRVAGVAMEDGVLEGLGGGATPGAEGGRIFVKPGGVGGKVTLACSHLMYAAS